jgi:hypothetical protein
MVAPDTVTGDQRDRPISLGVLQSQDWRGGQDDAATCHMIEHGHDTMVGNDAIPGGGPVTAESYGDHDVALLTAARALARRSADQIDACFHRSHAYSACRRVVRRKHIALPGGFVDGPGTFLGQDGYTVEVVSNAGTYRVGRNYRGAPRSESCAAIRVTTCPPGLAP